MTTTDARSRILAKLRAAQAPATPAGSADANAYYAAVTPTWADDEKLRRLVSAMRAVKSEVHLLHEADWPAALAARVQAKGVRRLLLAPHTAHGARAVQALQALPTPPQCSAYAQPIEAWKAELFHSVDAGFTTTRAAIADTGSLILWPDADEPRTLSLVPPIHFALADARRLYANFHEAMSREGWAAQGMPSNALLVSGPSKTSDIQQTLAYGAHGPRELVLLMVVPDGTDIAALEAAL
jgi:L-lactate dehydrogenase complex protein LldG